MEVGGQRHAPAALPPGKTQYPLHSGPQGRSGRVRKISPPTGIRSPDLPARSESLYRLGYPGPWSGGWRGMKGTYTGHGGKAPEEQVTDVDPRVFYT